MSSSTANDSTHPLDTQLLLRVAQGEKAALGELYDRWFIPLRSLAGAQIKDPAHIEDVLHDTFITLWQKAGDFDPAQGSPYDWAATLTRQFARCEHPSDAPIQSAASLDLQPPSAALRARILNSAVPLPAEVRYLPPLPSPPAWLGWCFAALFAVGALFFAAKSFNVRSELQAVLDLERVTRLEAVTLKNLLEAERILSRAQLERLFNTERLNAELRSKLSAETPSSPH